MNNNFLQKSTILVVDDTPTNLSVLLDYLNQSGFKTLIAQDGEGALEQADFAHPDIILLDVMMPGIDGFETCKRLKENGATKDIPVIFMTALSETVDKVKGFQYGAVDYITKPFQQEEVLMRITTHLTIQHQKKELNDLNQKLMASNATKDKFFSIIAHDMRSAFTPMVGYSDLLIRAAEELENKKILKYSNNMQMMVENAHKLFKNLLDWARIQRGAMEYKPNHFDLYSIGMSNVVFLMNPAKQKNIEIKLEIEKNTICFADNNMVDTILRNLMTNAVKFTQEGGEVRLFSTIKNDLIEICISDTGVGIAPENQDKLFTIDNKHKSAGTAGEQGTGLGLILCKELVEKNGGKIWVTSEKNKGAKFLFTLTKSDKEEEQLGK
ncbi:Response regulator receiver sensor signal transduction histidine kinase [Candidatus Magnetomorum sp. HK-1]|nr:Response regulator receiver sensor signal transduction histidine kinase [Candidatus Magnetomorum sp. HK-1]